MEFSGILGEGHIFLNGEEIGSTSAPSSFNYKRAYRFCCTFADGKNRLTVKLRTDARYAAAVEGAAIGRTVKPRVSHQLFGGSMLVILKGRCGSRLAATSADGRHAEIRL